MNPIFGPVTRLLLRQSLESGHFTLSAARSRCTVENEVLALTTF